MTTEERWKVKQEIGIQFWKWFHSHSTEMVEDAIERITDTKDPQNI